MLCIFLFACLLRLLVLLVYCARIQFIDNIREPNDCIGKYTCTKICNNQPSWSSGNTVDFRGRELGSRLIRGIQVFFRCLPRMECAMGSHMKTGTTQSSFITLKFNGGNFENVAQRH